MINYNNRPPFEWLNKDSRDFLNKGYLMDGETGEERIRFIGDTAQKRLIQMFRNKHGVSAQVPEILTSYSDKFFDYMSRGWYSLASPVWANFGRKRGYPISCFSSYFDDDMEHILDTNSEVGMMTKQGGGTSGYFGSLRPRGAPISTGGESEGVCSFLELTETISRVCKQSSVRRGAFAAYLPIEHDDFDEFIRIRQEGHPLQSIFFGVSIGDEFMKSILKGDNEANREKWCKLLDARTKTGMPYIFFRDTVNNNKPQVYKDLGKTIYGSNLCSEITLSTNPDESFVCCLSSQNLLYFDEWADTDATLILSLLLDAVMEEFIEKTRGQRMMARARKFAVEQRALGLGVLGWHSYLQSKMISFEEMQAKFENSKIFGLLGKQTKEATKLMAGWFGEPKLLEGYGIRNVTMMAIAPTMSSSFILGQVSSGIEPLHSNGFEQELAKAKVSYRNPVAVKVLEKYGKNTSEVWESIFASAGSVQHLDFLTDHEREVLLTFMEIGQKEILIQAAARQKDIDQSQSVNLFIDPSQHEPQSISDLYISAWQMGIKTLYYQKNVNAAQIADVDEDVQKLRQVDYVDTFWSKMFGARFRKPEVTFVGVTKQVKKHKPQMKSLASCSSCEG